MKKILLTTIIISSIATTFIGIGAKVAEATTLFHTVSNTKYLPGSDNWNRGIKNPGNGWYLPFSYYYNSSYSHNASAYTKQDGLNTSGVASPGNTASINAKNSVQSYAGAYLRAGADSGGWKYTKDQGNGEYK